MYSVYILKCRDRSLYTGITTDLKRRIKQHSQGVASKYTRSRLPVKCVYKESQPNASRAKKRECQIKSWNKQEKLEFLNRRLGANHG